MNQLQPNLYAGWRASLLAPSGLRETADSAAPPERLLHAVWLHQRLLRGQLTTLDGQPVRILHPGFHNYEAGPDFRGAVVQFNNDQPQTGDVEIDLLPSHWQAHRHHLNPDFNNVILHVVWDVAGTINSALPILKLKPVLDASLDEITTWLGTDAARRWPPDFSGQCCATMSGMSQSVLQELLRQAARIRLQVKAMQLLARARQAGWEQALWEGLFRALGYKHNVWPMQHVAESIPNLSPQNQDTPLSVLGWQARLLGVGGLLPAESWAGRPSVSRYLTKIWEHWWRERNAVVDLILPRHVWRFHGLRPANYPQRRLALAAHWLANHKFLSNLESWFTASLADNELSSSLLELLQIEQDDFWSWRWTFRSAQCRQPQPMLGQARATDLAINVILPWFWIRARSVNNSTMQAAAEKRYFAWPKAEDNAVLRLARQRLLGGGSSRRFRSAADQQGLLQIIRDFCDHSNAICADCPFPELLRAIEQ